MSCFVLTGFVLTGYVEEGTIWQTLGLSGEETVTIRFCSATREAELFPASLLIGRTLVAAPHLPSRIFSPLAGEENAWLTAAILPGLFHRNENRPVSLKGT